MVYLMLHWFKWQAAISGKHILSKEFKSKEVDEILKNYWQRYLVLKPAVPYMPTMGGRIMVQLAAMSTAFYTEITQRGKDAQTATKIFYEIAWIVYNKMGTFTWNLAGMRKKKDLNKLMLATKLFRQFPFNSPSYEWIDQPGPDNAVCFNCVKCPVAEYFKAHNLSKFCVETWCALDYPLAQKWHSRLERSGSIAGGAEVCDFKWISE